MLISEAWLRWVKVVFRTNNGLDVNVELMEWLIE